MRDLLVLHTFWLSHKVDLPLLVDEVQLMILEQPSSRTCLKYIIFFKKTVVLAQRAIQEFVQLMAN